MGEVRESRKARCATELLNGFWGAGVGAVKGESPDVDSWIVGAGGGAKFGAGRGGGIERRLATPMCTTGDEPWTDNDIGRNDPSLPATDPIDEEKDSPPKGTRI